MKTNALNDTSTLLQHILTWLMESHFALFPFPFPFVSDRFCAFRDVVFPCWLYFWSSFLNFKKKWKKRPWSTPQARHLFCSTPKTSSRTCANTLPTHSELVTTSFAPFPMGRTWLGHGRFTAITRTLGVWLKESSKTRLNRLHKRIHVAVFLWVFV